MATDPAGVQEPAVPIFHNNTLIGGENHQAIEAFDQVPGTISFRLTWVDLPANGFIRTTYPKPSGTTGALGSSVVGTPSFRTPGGFNFIPTVNRSDVTPGGTFHYDNTVAGQFGLSADVVSRRGIAVDPLIGQTQLGLDLQFKASQPILLATGSPFVGNDRFRIVTLLSMFSSLTQFDANVLRWEDALGFIRLLRLDDNTSRGAHLLPSPDEIGSWFELVKEPTSTWFPDSPTIRVTLADVDGLRLGVQGFLATWTLTSDDSLSVWLEWLDAPDVIATGTSFDVSAQITATPPFGVPEPGSLTLLIVGVLLGLPQCVLTRRRWRISQVDP